MQEGIPLAEIEKFHEELNMTIQKKSLINSLNTTKKALVATSPEKGSARAGAVKPSATRLSQTAKLAKIKPAAFKPVKIIM